MTKVKICGITKYDDAWHAVECGADMLGFNFYSESKRFISPEGARRIIDSLPIMSGIVGVFVNESPDTVLEITSFVGLDAIQLHGDEDSAYVSKLNTSLSLIHI